MSPAWTRHWSGGPPSDWDEIRARLRSFSDLRSGRLDETPARAPAPTANGQRAAAAAPPTPQPARRMPMGAPSAEDLDYGMVFDLPVIRWWKVHNPLVMQRAVLLLCVMLGILLLLQAF